MKQLLVKIFSVHLILLLTFNCYSQNKKLLDSLNMQLKICKDDADKVNLYYAIASAEKDYKNFIENVNNAYDLSESLNQIDALKRSYDSLYSRLMTCQIDTQKVLLYYKLSEATEDTALIRQLITAGIKHAISVNYGHGSATGLNSLGQYFRIQGLQKYPQAIVLYDSALNIATRINNKGDMATSYHNLGQIYRFKGDYARALDYYNKANVVAHEAQDSTQIMWNYHDLGWMRISMKDYSEAIAYLNQGVALAIATNNTYVIGDINMHIGEAYWFMGKYDSSLFFSNKAYEIFKPINSKENMIHCLNQLGWVYESRLQWKEAEDAYLRAIKLSEDPNSAWTARAYAGLGDALYGRGQYKEALLNYKAAEKVMRFESIDRLTKDCYEGLAKTYSKVGDFKNAYEAHIKFKNASDSVLILENSEKLLATQAQHDDEKLKSEAKAAQEKKDFLQQAELANQRTQKYIIISGAALLLLIAIGLISRLRFARKSRLQLEEKNKLIAEEKEIADQQRERAERSEKFKQQFLANMSHEIRTPMNAVMGMTNLLIEKNPRIDQFSYLDGIKKSSDNLLHIINDILDLSKIEVGKMELEQIDFSVRDMVEQVKQTLYYKAEEKGLELITNIDSYIPDVLIGDPTRLNQVLLNLAGNAIKFTEKGSVEIKVQSAKNKIQGDSTWNFSIIDTGIGISKDKLQTVFESFSQANASDTRIYGGTGLGLSISKQLVELMGGKIDIESEEGAGTVFSFEINLPIGSMERMEEQRSSEQIDGSILNGLKILVVDDNEYNRVVVQDTLKLMAEVEIFQAVNGREAIIQAEENNFDVILMDVQMPIMDGFEATQHIRQKFSAPENLTPIIALTASVIRSDLDKCRAAGMNDYVPKPFKPYQLISAIARATGREMKFATKKTDAVDREKENHSSVTNLSYLEKFCEGDKMLMQKYINMFIASAPVLIEKLNTALLNNDLEEIASQVHGFKTKWIMMGMTESKALAQILEQQCRGKEQDISVKENVLKLMEQIRVAIMELT